MTDIERQILFNQIALLEAMIPTASKGPDGTRELLRQRYRESADLIRKHSPSKT